MSFDHQQSVLTAIIPGTVPFTSSQHVSAPSSISCLLCGRLARLRHTGYTICPNLISRPGEAVGSHGWVPNLRSCLKIYSGSYRPKLVSPLRLPSSKTKTYDMSQPSTTTRRKAAYAIKRKKPVESSSQPAPSTRPPMPLPPADKPSNDRALREIRSQPRVGRQAASQTDAGQILRPRATVEKGYSDKQKVQLFPIVCDEVKQMKERSARLAEERRKVDEDRDKLAEELREAKCMCP